MPGRGEMPPVRVLIVEDFEPFRQFVCSILRARSDFEIIAAVEDGLEAVQVATDQKPDLILLDIGLPKLNGFQAAVQIREASPDSKIIFVTQETSPEVVHKALDIGAAGYVLKSHAGKDLVPAVEAVIQERRFVTESLARS
jgi:DNA-binding NarL/FixJ family response regulator